jgi:hypothetical protein
MKTERRHELQHNSLDTEMGKILGYLKTNVKGISLAILTLVAVITVGMTVIRNRAAAVSGPRQDYDGLKTQNVDTAEGRKAALTGFEELASQTGNMRVAAMACVEVGDISVRQKFAGDYVTGALDTAEKYYQRVISDFSDVPEAAGRAYLGLARLAEGKGDFAAAKGFYQKVVDLGSQTSPLATEAARDGLASLGDLKKSVRLATSRPAPPIIIPPVPTSQPAVPTTQPAAVTTQPVIPTTQPALPVLPLN